MIFLVKYILIPLSIVGIAVGYYWDYKKDKARKNQIKANNSKK